MIHLPLLSLFEYYSSLRSCSNASKALELNRCLSYVSSDSAQTWGHTTFQKVMAKVHQTHTQELHSDCNYVAVAGKAEFSGSSGVEQCLAVGSCADNWRAGNGLGEQRQGRWCLLSLPCLAESITDWLNMTELTLLSCSEGKRKNNGIKRLALAVTN